VPVPPLERFTVVGFSTRLRPGGDPVADRLTAPAKPFKLVRVTVEVELDPAGMLSELGLAETLKSGKADVGLKNSVIGVALPSPVLRLAKPQFVSIVFGNE
jgi:hypothetical protein